MENSAIQLNIPIGRSMMPGDQILSVKYVEMEMILKKLKKSGKLDDSLKWEIDEYEKMLQSGRKACQACTLKIFKWPSYDYAWVTLRRVRRGLAGILPLKDEIRTFLIQNPEYNDADTAVISN